MDCRDSKFEKVLTDKCVDSGHALEINYNHKSCREYKEYSRAHRVRHM